MSYSIAEAKDMLSGILHGKTPNKITNIDSAGRRAAQNVLAMVDPDETRKITQITLYDGIVDTPAPPGLKEKRIVDIRPQFNTNNSRPSSDNLSNRLSKDFDLRRGWGSLFTIMDDGGLKYLRVKTELTPSKLSLDTLDEIGGWAATAPAQNLVAEDIIFTQGALQFDIAAGVNPTSGFIQSSTINSQDMTDLVNKSAGFFTLYIPTAAILASIISVDLRWGNNNTTVFFNRTVTVAHLGALRVGKNTIRIDWNGATQTGVVDVTKIDSARITVTTNGTAVAGLIVSNLFFSIARVWDIEYYSKYIFSTSAGVWGETIGDDTNLVNLDTASYNLFLYEWALACFQQIQGRDALADRTYFYKELHGDNQKEGLYKLYKMNNPSQAEKPTRSYYTNLGWRGGNGDRYRRF